MKRTQLQLEEAMYDRLRRLAYERGVSIAAVIRETLEETLGGKTTRPRSIGDFRFVASGRADETSSQPVSEKHDEALAEYFDQ